MYSTSPSSDRQSSEKNFDLNKVKAIDPRNTADEVSIVSGTTTDDLEQSSSFTVPTSTFHAKVGDNGEPLIPQDCKTPEKRSGLLQYGQGIFL